MVYCGVVGMAEVVSLAIPLMAWSQHMCTMLHKNTHAQMYVVGVVKWMSHTLYIEVAPELVLASDNS